MNLCSDAVGGAGTPSLESRRASPRPPAGATTDRRPRCTPAGGPRAPANERVLIKTSPRGRAARDPVRGGSLILKLQLGN